MEKGFLRFEYYLTRLEELLLQAEKTGSASEFLYANDARTTLFMLEGLSRIYAYIYGNKLFTKLRDHFKLLEDALGYIDYYDSFAREFKANPNTPITATAYLRTKMVEKKAAFQQILLKKKWIGKKNGRLSKIRRKLRRLNWQSEKSDIRGLASFYHDSIAEIQVLALETAKGFTELEDEVHEMRRRLRWLSIYPRAMQGAIQLHDNPALAEQMKQYLVPEIVNSPFNIMPEIGDNLYFLQHNKNNFFALSWMISELGKLKDEGLKIYALSEALEVTEDKDTSWATKLALELMQLPPDAMSGILLRASAAAGPYFEGGYLINLVYGISKNS